MFNYFKTSTFVVDPSSVTVIGCSDAVTAMLRKSRVRCAFRSRVSAENITGGGAGAKSSNCLTAAAVASKVQDESS